VRIVPLAEAKARLDDYVDRVATEGPVVITRNGRAVAVLLAAGDDDDLERLLLSRSPRFQEMIEESRRSITRGEGLPSDAFWNATEEHDGPDSGAPPDDVIEA